MMCPLHFPQVSIWALLSVFADDWGNITPLVAASVAWWRLLWQEMLWCLISCVVWWSLPCGRPHVHELLSMLLHSYMSERCLWGSIHIWSIVSHKIPFIEGRSHDYHQLVSQPTSFQSIIQIDRLDITFGHSVCCSHSTSLCVCTLLSVPLFPLSWYSPIPAILCNEGTSHTWDENSQSLSPMAEPYFHLWCMCVRSYVHGTSLNAVMFMCHQLLSACGPSQLHALPPVWSTLWVASLVQLLPGSLPLSSPTIKSITCQAAYGEEAL